jgi:carboxymethylenebutenolidase
MSDELRAQAIALYDRYTHEGLDRRAFMAEMTRIAGSTAAAGALVAGIAADPARPAIVPADDKRLARARLNGRSRAGASCAATLPRLRPARRAAPSW